MRTISVKYPTKTQVLDIAGKKFVLEVIRSLDEAIDLLCNELSEEEQKDPFAEDLCPYFGVLWPSARALAQFIAARPELVKDKKVIELGCGLALPSLVATHLKGDVLATDFHPDVEHYVQRNARHSEISIKYQRLNWRESNSIGTFDVILGSDILYESKHPDEVALGLLRYSRKGSTIILSDPGRAYLQKFIESMNKLGHQEEIFFVDVEGEEQFVVLYRI